MHASVEMVEQELNEMLAQRELLLHKLDCLGMYSGFDSKSSIVVFDAGEFFKYAECFEADVKEDNYKPEHSAMCVSFSYCGHDFECYLSNEEVEEYEDRIIFLPEDRKDVTR